MTECNPIAWPEGWPRTPTEKQDKGWQFKRRSESYGGRLVSFAEGRDSLYDELRKLGAESPFATTNHPTERYGIPTESKRRVGDEGVAVYFSLDGRQMVMASDRFDNSAANMRSLALAIEALRQLERHGSGTMMEKAFTGFVALPSPKDPHVILGVRPGASYEEIDAAYRVQAKRVHPDVHGGDVARMAELNEAQRKLKGQAA